ncbi:ATP-grasp domain-containing protein [Candidatus Dojkabacteria bacterium]|nr:ATP-grasp domain-containing protein [Candidatus Dojkabacteria bacterium]
MDTLDSLLEKVNQKTKDKPIFFATNDSERALGLEKVLDNYHVLCIDDNDVIDYLKKENVKIFCLEKELNTLNSIFRNSNRLLNHERTQEYIKKNTKGQGAYLMFFKIAPNLERTSEKLNFDLLNTSSKLNRKFELKISQYKSIKSLDIRIPKTRIYKLTDTNYEDLVKVFGKNIIMQFNRGHTGGGTIRIDSKIQLEELKEIFPERTVRIASYIKGIPYTLNACITKHGICWGGLSFQITGVEECTAKKDATVGNDWLLPKNLLSERTKKEIDKFTKNIGEEMQKNGFRGMFGLDIVVDDEKEEAYVIEINARQPASIPMHTKLQLKERQIPLNLLAIAEFLDIDYRIDVESYNLQASAPIEAAQLFIRNQFDHDASVIGAIKVGAYRMVGDNLAYDWSSGKPKLKSNVIMIDEEKDKPLIFEKEAYSIDETKKAGILILCVKEHKVVSPNGEVARIQVQQTLFDNRDKLKAWASEVVKGICKYVILQEKTNDRKDT